MKTVLLVSAIVMAAALAVSAAPTAALAADSITAPKLIGPTDSCVPNEILARKEIDLKREVHVITCYNVGLDGAPQDVTIAYSGGSDVVDTAARQCVTRLRYEPATKNGQPMLFPLVQQFNWCRGEFSPHGRECKPLPVTAEMRATCQSALVK
jgi:hypothetical protein